LLNSAYILPKLCRMERHVKCAN